jgi:hypothetical protein
MLTVEAISYFADSTTELARALGVEPPSVYDWGEYPPPLRQLQIQALTGGYLMAEPNVFDTKKAEKEPA